MTTIYRSLLHSTLFAVLFFFIGTVNILADDADPYKTHWQKGPDHDGSAEKPYVISTVDGLKLLASEMNNNKGKTFKDTCFVLGADIAFTPSDNNFTAIHGLGFNGHLDGQNKRISGIRIQKTTSNDTCNYQGLFGLIGTGGKVVNVTLANIQISGYQYVGGIAGCNKGTIDSCVVGEDVIIHTYVSDAKYHGGIAGYNDNNGTISNCTSSVTLTTGEGVSLNSVECYGGIAGSNNKTVSQCETVRARIPAVNDAGAVVGENTKDGSLDGNKYHSTFVGTNLFNIGTSDGDVDYGAVVTNDLFLTDNTDSSNLNATLIAAYAEPASHAASDKTGSVPANFNVTLLGRTIYRDTGWNTLCLPFGMTGSTKFNGTTLSNFTVMTLNGASFNNSTGAMILDFETAPTIEAGKPYIIRFSETGYANIDNPKFEGVTLQNVSPETQAVKVSDVISFKGNYETLHYNTKNNKVLFLGAANSLYYPDGAAPTTVNAFRCHFELLGNIVAGEPQNGVRSFELNFNDTPSAIHPTVSSESEEYELYTLDGRKVANGNNLKKGIYIRRSASWNRQNRQQERKVIMK